MEETIRIEHNITKDMEGTYFEIPFKVPPNVERIDIRYDYMRYELEESGNILKGKASCEVNIVDLGLSSPMGFVGASGSDRTHIWVGERGSANGYNNTKMIEGQWGIIVGAYKIQAQGVKVNYQITYTFKERRLFKGDTHMHTIASDGNNTVDGLKEKAVYLGLDYIILTDHNNYTQNYEITGIEEISIIPGIEWTHYNGHCNMYGVKSPLKNALNVNNEQDMRAKLEEARANGAYISINHPFCRNCGWKWGLENIDFDMIEIWNGGGNPEDNLKAKEWWHEQLVAGKKIAVIGGSDYHRTEVMREIGQPTTGVWAMSDSAEDILLALSQGHSYISLSHDGPSLILKSGEKIMGDTTEDNSVTIEFENLRAGDEIHIITDCSIDVIHCEKTMKTSSIDVLTMGKRFYRVEIYRNPWKDFNGQPILISNAIYCQ